MDLSSDITNGIGQPVRRKGIFVCSPAEAALPTISIYPGWRML
jgi:hypothetical protein